MQAGIFLLSTSRLSVVQELVETLAGCLGVQPSSGALERVFRHSLKETGLVDYQVLPFFHSGLAAARLTPAGKRLAGLLGYDCLETEWERLLRLHAAARQPRHTAMVLAFTREARRRDYRAIVVPARPSTPVDTCPDVLLVRHDQRVYVEVERRRGKLPKWINLEAQQGFVAVCTLTARSRATISREIVALGLPGQATDLETLRRRSLQGEPGPLWLDSW